MNTSTQTVDDHRYLVRLPNGLIVAATRARPHEGYLYIARYCTGRIKIGQTKNPTKRLGNLVSAATVHDRQVTAAWLSEPRLNFRESEEKVLQRAAQLGVCAAGFEFYDGVDMDDLITFVRMLPPQRWNEDYRSNPAWQEAARANRCFKTADETEDEYGERVALVLAKAAA
jgi:hypothetical protein